MKKLYVLVAVCILASLALMGWAFYDGGQEQAPTPSRYVMLTMVDRGTAVMQLKQGAQTAADFLGVSLIIEPAVDSEASLLARAAVLVEEGVDGILLPPLSDDTLARLREIARDIPLLSIWAETPHTDAFVVTDFAAQGKLLADAAQRADAILVGSDTPSSQRLQGILAALGREVPLYPNVDALLKGTTAGDIVLVADAGMTGALATIAGDRLAIWGIDPGDARVQLLEDGLVQGLVMEMPYAQGYQAVQTLHAIRQNENAERSVYTESRMVTAETMYDAEVVKLVFPLLQ